MVWRLMGISVLPRPRRRPHSLLQSQGQLPTVGQTLPHNPADEGQHPVLATGLLLQRVR